MSGQDLHNELWSVVRRSEELIKEQRADGSELAECEYHYRVKAAQKAAALRASGEAIGMIDILVKGDREVALARKQRDAAKSIYEAGKSAGFVNQTKIRILEAQIAREYR